MARRIQILPDRVVNQIAAGEVVERPASVVKELAENSLDAGARRVEVAIRNGGKTEIRVADDGHGMGREDALLSLDRHATSKIRDADDLPGVRSLGFRGEALPSIASVSRLTLESSERDAGGTLIRVSGGQVSAVESCARRRGTTITVRSLFYNIPARAKFLKSAAAETRATGEVMTTLALAHPGIALRLESNGKPLLDLSPAATLAERIGGIWGGTLAGELIPIAHRAGEISVSGLVQRPRNATRGGRRAYLFVNGRPFAERGLVRAAARAYQTTVAPGVRPSVFLMIEVPGSAVDVNVHPAKAEVRFREPVRVEAAVEEAVRAALRLLDSAPNLQRAPARNEAPELRGELQPPQTLPGQAATNSPAATPSGAPRGAEGDASRWANGGEPQMTLFVPAAQDAEERDGAAPPPPGPPPASAMWQVHNTYIFAETRDGLIIVDQHSAHERVLYEEMMAGFAAGPADSQRLLFPLTVRLAPAELALAEELGTLLERTGFEIEPFGGQSIIVHAVPNPHPWFDPQRCLLEMLAELTQGSPLVNSVRNQHQRIALSFACKAAIKAGQRLSAEEINTLFDRLWATELPYHDIHGRPTVVQLPIAELHARFGRSG